MDIVEVIVACLGAIGSLLAYIFKSTLTELKEGQNSTFKKIDRLGDKMGEWQKEMSDEYLKSELAEKLYERKKNSGE